MTNVVLAVNEEQFKILKGLQFWKPFVWSVKYQPVNCLKPVRSINYFEWKSRLQELLARPWNRNEITDGILWLLSPGTINYHVSLVRQNQSVCTYQVDDRKVATHLHLVYVLGQCNVPLNWILLMTCITYLICIPYGYLRVDDIFDTHLKLCYEAVSICHTLVVLNHN